MDNLNDSKKHYTAMINRVQDHIQENIDRNITLDELSSIALFSKYHLQRIYSMMTSETLYSYIKRLRLEKAAYMLRHAKTRSIQDIALSVGFSNQSSFAKAFKTKFGVASSGFRSLNDDEIRAIINNSTIGKVSNKTKEYTKPIDISIKTEKQVRVIYLRHQGMYKGNKDLFKDLFSKLYTYCDEINMMGPESEWCVIYHDFGELSPDDMLRLSVCMSIDEGVKVSEEFGIMDIDGGRYGVGRFKVTEDDYQRAWNYMFGVWLPNSGYMPDDRACFEYYPKRDDCNDGEQIVDIYIPISSL